MARMTKKKMTKTSKKTTASKPKVPTNLISLLTDELFIRDLAEFHGSQLKGFSHYIRIYKNEATTNSKRCSRSNG